MVPAAGLEPARIIHPPDFESGTSTNFITRGWAAGMSGSIIMISLFHHIFKSFSHFIKRCHTEQTQPFEKDDLDRLDEEQVGLQTPFFFDQDFFLAIERVETLG